MRLHSLTRGPSTPAAGSTEPFPAPVNPEAASTSRRRNPAVAGGAQPGEAGGGGRPEATGPRGPWARPVALGAVVRSRPLPLAASGPGGGEGLQGPGCPAAPGPPPLYE